jgi:hypothetical protein
MCLDSKVVHMARAESRAARNMADVPDMIVSNDCLVVVREAAGSFGLSSPGMHIDLDLATPFSLANKLVEPTERPWD